MVATIERALLSIYVHLAEKGGNVRTINLKRLAWASVAAAAVAAGASPACSGLVHASITIDKPDYNYDYVFGVRAYTSTASSEVVVDHDLSPASSGSWALAADGSGTSWWDWAPFRPVQALGPLSGSFTITARDDNGLTFLTGTLSADADMAFPVSSIVERASSYVLGIEATRGADYYNVWVWDPVERFYAWSVSGAEQPGDFIVDKNRLVAGRTYNVYFMANNRIELGPNFTGLYRSYGLRYLQAAAPGIPEPQSWAAMMCGFVVMGSVLRRARRGDVQRVEG